MANRASRWCQLAAGLALGLGAPAAWSLDPLPAAAQAQEAAGHDTAHDPAEVFNFGLDANARMTVPVSIGSDGPYSFVIDTASTRTVLGSELAAQLNLRDGPDSKIISMSDTKLTRTVIVPSLQVNGRTVKSIRAPVLAVKDIGAAGILGLDALKSQRVVVDFVASTMAITSSSRTPEDWQGEMIVVTGKSRLGQLVLADASVDDTRVYVIIDTGGEVSMGNEALRQKLFGSDKDKSWKKIALLSATGGTTVADYTTVDRLRIAGLGITHLPIAFGDANPFHALDLMKQPALLLGMDTLSLFDRVTVDFAQHKVWFLWTGQGSHGQRTF